MDDVTKNTIIGFTLLSLFTIIRLTLEKYLSFNSSINSNNIELGRLYCLNK